MNGSGNNGFSAADIPESESEESGDQSDLNPAGKRSAGSATTTLNPIGNDSEIDLNTTESKLSHMHIGEERVMDLIISANIFVGSGTII